MIESLAIQNNAIITTQNNISKSISKLLQQKEKKMVTELKKKLNLKNSAKKISKEEYDLKLENIYSQFKPQLEYIEKYKLESLFEEKLKLSLDSDFVYQNLESKYNLTYFKEIYLDCRKMMTLGNDSNKARYHNPNTNEILWVEDLALHYYINKEIWNQSKYSIGSNQSDQQLSSINLINEEAKLSGIHSENGLGLTLFGLFLWNQIFDDSVPGVFQSPFQNGPLDFGSKEFYFRREKNIINRLEQISLMNEAELKQEIEDLWEIHYGTLNQTINWDSIKFSKIKLTDIVVWFGGKRISHIISNYAKDLKHWSHGLPDLILWNINTKEVKFSEVKSETDRLSNVQKAWIVHLSNGCIPVELWHVKDVYDPKAVEVF